MRRADRLTPTLALAILLAGCTMRQPLAAAPAPDAAAILRAAQRQAASSPDPVAAKLAIWLRAQVQGAASAAEIDGFLRANPDWPGRAVLGERLQQALAVEPDDAVARTLCASRRPDTPLSLLRCALARAPAPLVPTTLAPTTLVPRPQALPADLAPDAVAAWRDGTDDAAQEALFVRLFGTLPTPADQWRRFDREEWSGVEAATRQVARLPAAAKPLAVARLALRHGEAGADRLAAALRGAAARDGGMLLDLARWQRRHEQLDAALALWRGPAGAAEAAAPASRAAAFWSEREALAREMLGVGRDADALSLAADTLQTDPAARSGADFLAGWILLRRLHAAPRAARYFAGLTGSHAVITAARGYYWLGRALSEAGGAEAARAAFAEAASRPTSFYGQAAMRELYPGDGRILAARLAALHDPGWTRAQAIGFAGLELARAATLLVAWNDPGQARGFLLRLDQMAATDSQHALAASFADGLRLPDVAVAIARSAGRGGLVLAQSGWPAPYPPPAEPALPPGLALALMRQESSFDPAVVSPAGAHGLMQLMPATARTLSPGQIDLAALSDPAINMELGTRYLAGLLDRFHGRVPYAVAAYNAGPNRVQKWLTRNGDPAAGGRDEMSDAMIDWIELIPFNETRSYVQRVMENQAIYRIRAAGGGAADPGGRLASIAMTSRDRP